MVILLYGGVGAGKSAALSYLKEAYAADVIGTDETAHELYETGREGYRAVLRLLGERVKNRDGSLNRKKMADLLYRDPALLEKLDAGIHPLVLSELKKKISGSKAPCIVVETALPQKTESDMFDEVWYVYTPEEVRIERLMKNRGYSRERAREIMSRQPSEKEYRSHADLILDNGGTVEDLKRQIDDRMRRGMS